MAYRCTRGEHGPCTACHEFIVPTQRDHSHIFRGGGRKDDILCAECWLRIAVSATAILKALKAAGIEITDLHDLSAFLNSHIAIGVDVPFAWDPPARN